MIRHLGLGSLHSPLEEEPRQSGLNWLAAKADYLDRNTTEIRKALTSSELSTQGGDRGLICLQTTAAKGGQDGTKGIKNELIGSRAIVSCRQWLITP